MIRMSMSMMMIMITSVIITSCMYYDKKWIYGNGKDNVIKRNRILRNFNNVK